MGIVLFVLLLTIFCVAAAIAFVITEEGLGKVAVSSAIALLLLLLLVFIVAPIELGHGRVPDTAEEFARRLEGGKVYYVIATDDIVPGTNAEKIVLVREAGTSSYTTIRVKVSSTIPGHFTLINGLPHEVK